MKAIEVNKIKNGALIEKLIELVFNKVAQESNETSGYGLSKYLHASVKEKIAERTLLRYYDGYVLNKKNEKTKPNSFSLDVLSMYLGFENFLDFSLKKKAKSKSIHLNKKTSIIGSSIIILLMSYLGYNRTKKNCMIWINNDHYEKVSCEEKESLQSIPKDMNVLENFKRVVPDSTYVFFKINGKENLWYERNIKGNLEYFTSHGEHPITGETLKKITPHMIKKYIWSDYKY